MTMSAVVAERDMQAAWSRIPNGHVVASAIEAMRREVATGVPAPAAPRLAADATGDVERVATHRNDVAQAIRITRAAEPDGVIVAIDADRTIDAAEAIDFGDG